MTGPGYVKTLHDDPATGKAGRATLFATPRSGGQGLCFLGDDLLITADHWLSRYRDADGDGRADGAPERIIPLATAEHGGHAIRKGPDGWIYAIAGNDAGIDGRHVGTPGSPVARPVAGGIVRLSPDLKICEVVAHGFRNPYDFDFNPLGRPLHLRQATASRTRSTSPGTRRPGPSTLAEEGGHHGWRLKGYSAAAFSPLASTLFDAIPPLADPRPRLPPRASSAIATPGSHRLIATASSSPTGRSVGSISCPSGRPPRRIRPARKSSSSRSAATASPRPTSASPQTATCSSASAAGRRAAPSTGSRPRRGASLPGNRPQTSTASSPPRNRSTPGRATAGSRSPAGSARALSKWR